MYDNPENYRELPESEWPVTPEPEEPTPYEPGQEEPYQEPQEPGTIDELAEAKASKLRAIESYDSSPNVNGFRLDGNLMWLDRETRASLRNTIESATLLGRTELDIWFGDIHVTLPIQTARYMLATLEMYATDCYNVTSQHRVQVRALETVESVDGFDVTDGYPQMPEFTTQQAGE